MATSIQTAFPMFFDNEGAALDGGRVYIGVAGENPELSPQSVFWDAALTVTATQPLEVVKGRIVRNGVASEVFTSGGYSITTRDAKRRIVNTSLFNDSKDAANVYVYDGRAAMEAAVSGGLVAPDGALASDGTVQYVASAGATDLPGLPGWLPFGVSQPQHYSEDKDADALSDAMSDPISKVLGGIYTTTNTVNVSAGSRTNGNGVVIDRDASGSLDGLSVGAGSNVTGVTVDMNMSADREDGQGVRLLGSDTVLEWIEVNDFGTDDAVAGGGTGIIDSSGVTSENQRLHNATLRATPDATLAFGWLYSNDRYSFADNVAVYNVSRYAHELKNDCQFNILHSLLAVDSQYAIAFGQSAADGADKNLTFGVLGSSCDSGSLIGWGDGNLSVGCAYYQSDTQLYPDFSPSMHGIRVNNGNENSFTSHYIEGDNYNFVTRVDGNNNLFDFYNNTPGTSLFRVDGGTRNVANISHPGPDVNSVRDLFSVASGSWDYRGGSANVVLSPATGERLGSISGIFHDKLGDSGVTPNSSHHWWKEGDEFNLTAIMSDGSDGGLSGHTFYGRSGATQGRFWYVWGATASEDYYDMGVGGVNSIVRLRTYEVQFSKPIRNANYTVATVPPAGSVSEGSQIYVSDGDSGSPCLAVNDGSSWRRVPLGATISAT